jgi:quercetin dioxygenase-like cupin family protein
MNEFPAFMRRSANAVEASKQAGGLEGYVFEGADGSQMVIWQGHEGGRSEMHTHDYDEYCIVLQGTFVGTVGGVKVVLGPGDEGFIPAGVPHDGEYSANYRAIDAFGGRRVRRA